MKWRNQLSPSAEQTFLSEITQRGLNIIQWRWMRDHAHITLDRAPPRIASSCIWWNEI